MFNNYTNLSASTVAIVVGVAVFTAVIAFFTYRFFTHNKKETWLFANWQENIYDSLIKQKPIDFSKSVYINAEEYINNCNIVKRKPNLKKVIINKIVGIFLVSIGVSLFALTLNVWPLIILFLSIPLLLGDTYKAKNEVKRRKQKLEYELPRFLDLFYTALSINLSVEDAIIVTCQNMKNSVLSEEFLASIADTQMGASNWQEALEKLSEKYAIDSLSDFVLDLINTFNKGASILASVERQSKDIKKNNLLTMKENASKLSNTILIPILIFKIFPVLALIIIPIIQQLNSTLV